MDRVARARGRAPPPSGVRGTAVIAAIGRTPVARAGKGLLIDMRPDDLGALVVDGAQGMAIIVERLR